MENDYYWYSVAVQFIFEDEATGKTKKTKEVYMVEAVSVGDAETQVVKDLEDSSLNYRIVNITESRVNKILQP